MIEVPEFNEQNMYDAETHFNLLMSEDRLGKFVAHWEALTMTSKVPGHIVECGVFKGTSFVRLALMRELLGGSASARLVGFDVFDDDFPTTIHEQDLQQREHWIATAGGSSISVQQLRGIMEIKGLGNFELVPGDATKTIPKWAAENQGARISLLNIDIDFYEPTFAALECLWPRMSRGGIVLLDNYGGHGTSGLSYWGDTSAVDDFFKEVDVRIQRFPFVARPAYVIKL